MKKVLALILSIVMCAGLSAGCAPAAETPDTPSGSPGASAPQEAPGGAGEEKKYVVGVDLFYKSDEYYLDIETCMKMKAEELGMELVIQNADTVLSTQVQQVEDFITQGVDAIVMSAVDPVGSYACVEAANAAGIPIFMFDGITDNKEGITAYTIGDFVDEGEKTGQWAKKYIEENLNGECKYAVLDYFPSPVICGGRSKGFMSALEGMEGVTNVSHQDGKATRDGGMSVMEDILTANSNDVDMVFAINYESGAGAAAAIEAANAKTVVTCVAWNAEGFQKLEDNDPIMKAYLAAGVPTDIAGILDVVNDHLNGEQIETEIFMPSYVLDSSNIDTINWKEIVANRSN